MWVMKESLPSARRVRGGVGLVLRTYLRLLARREFLGAVLASGFTLGALFSYLTASSFVFIEMYRLTPEQYALVFGFNGAGLIAASQLNRWLLGRFALWPILSAALLVNALAGGLLVGAVMSGLGSLPMIIGLLFVSMSAAGIIFPNISALAMAPFPEVAGSASALLGMFQFGVGATSGALVGFFHNGTALPMAIGLATCAVAGLVVTRTMVR